MLMKALFIAEMVTYLPIASPFIRLGGFWVDDAWGFAMGWNYFFLMGEYQFSCQFYDL
jgi:amino acid permease